MDSRVVTPSSITRDRPRRLLFVTGKGGVGKTTVTAALALALSAQGKRVLIAMGGAHERLSALLRTPPVGHDLVRVRERVWATRIAPDRSMEEYGEQVIGVRAVTRLVFANRYTQAFFRAVPGLPEWAVLGKAWFLATHAPNGGEPAYDVVLFDAPSTGHALHMLRVPRVILALAPAGALRRDAERAMATFRDPAVSGVVLVTSAEHMAVRETLELAETVRGDLGMPIWGLVLNGYRAPLFSPVEAERLAAQAARAFESPPASSPGARAVAPSRAQALLDAVGRRATREQLQAHSLSRLEAAVAAPIVRLPFIVDGVDMPEAVESLAAAL